MIEIRALEHFGEQIAHCQTDDRPHHHLHREFGHQCQRRGARNGDEQQRGADQEDRHRVVGARFHLDQRGHIAMQVEPARAQDGENRGSIGRGDHRAEQEALQRLEPEQIDRRRGDDARAEQHPQRGEHHGGRQHALHIAPVGVEPA